MSNKFRIAVRKFGPFETAIEKIWTSFCEETGCDLELEAVAMDLHPLYEATLGTENGLIKGDWDVTHINTDWITEANEKNALENLDPWIEKQNPKGFPDAWSDSLLGMQKFDDRILGLPFHDGPECLIYRKDLFESSDEKTAFKKQYSRELRPPATWDELIEVAQFFQRPEENLYGTVVAAFPDGHNTVFDLCLQIWTRGGDIVNENGDVNIATKAAIDGLTFYRKLLRNKMAIHPKSSEMDSVKSGMAFANGEIALMVNWFGFASMCEVYPESKVKGCVDIVDVPAGQGGKETSLNVYWLYAIAQGSQHKKWAYDFIKYATNVKNDKLLTLEGGIGCRKSTWYDEEINKTVPYYNRLDGLHKNSRTLPRKAHWADLSTVIDKVVTEAINCNTPIKEILEKGQEEISEIEKKYN